MSRKDQRNRVNAHKPFERHESRNNHLPDGHIASLKRIVDAAGRRCDREFDDAVDRIVFTSLVEEIFAHGEREKESVLAELRQSEVRLLSIESGKSGLEERLKSVEAQVVALKSERDELLQRKGEEEAAAALPLGEERQKLLMQARRIEELEKQQFDLVDETDALTIDKIGLEEKCDKLESEIKFLKAATSQTERQSVAMAKSLDAVKEELHVVSAALTRAEAAKAEVMVSHEELEEEHLVVMKEAERLKKELLAMEKEFADAKMEIEQVNRKLEALELEKEVVIASHSELKRKYDAALTVAEKTEVELRKNLNEARSVSEMLKREMAVLEAEIANAAGTVAALEEEKAMLLLDLEESARERDSAVSARDDMAGEVRKLCEEKERLQLSLSRLECRCLKLERKSTNLQAEKAAIGRKLEAEMLEAEEMRLKMVELVTMHVAREKEVSRLETALATMAGELSMQRVDLDSLAVKEKAIERMADEVGALRAAIAEVQQVSQKSWVWVYRLGGAIVAALSLAFAVRRR